MLIPHIRPISARSTVAAQRLTQDHARSFCTMKTGTARVFLRLGRPQLGSPPDASFEVSPVRQNRTKRKMRAYSSDLERFCRTGDPNSLLAGLKPLNRPLSGRTTGLLPSHPPGMR